MTRALPLSLPPVKPPRSIGAPWVSVAASEVTSAPITFNATVVSASTPTYMGSASISSLVSGRIVFCGGTPFQSR